MLSFVVVIDLKLRCKSTYIVKITQLASCNLSDGFQLYYTHVYRCREAFKGLVHMHRVRKKSDV